MLHLGRHQIIWLVSVMATLLLLWVDVLLPRGIMDGYFYFSVMLACLLLPGQRTAFVYAATLSGAVFLGFWLSEETNPDDQFNVLGLENCFIAIAILWFTAVVISAYKRNEQDLIKTRSRLQQLNHEQAKFFSILAHDMRTPFQALIIFAEMLQQEEGREKARHAARNIHMISLNLATLLDNLLAWGRTQMGLAHANPGMLALQPLVRSVCDLLQPNATAKNITLTEKTEGIEVFADTDMVQTIIRNLVSNAIKFTPSGGRVTVEAWTQGDAAGLVVSDTGAGMSPDQIATLFKLTETGASPGTAGETGTGLGLALCRDFVERNGGHISVASSLDRGTAVTVTLPIKG